MPYIAFDATSCGVLQVCRPKRMRTGGIAREYRHDHRNS